MAAFSRLQLAAALLEYDNDTEDPNAPKRSAQESAIFAPMRRQQARPQHRQRRSTDYLSVALPTDAPGTSSGQRSVTNHRKSQASVDALRNPFGPDEHDSQDEEPNVDEMEVDLSSWGLDAFVPKEKGNGEKSDRRSRQRAKSATLGGRLDGVRREAHSPARVANIRSRSMSVGNFDGFGLGEAFLDAESSAPEPGARPHSFASPMDLVGMAPPERPPHLRRQSDHALIDKIPSAPPLHSVPFPRSTTPVAGDEFGVMRPASRASMGSQGLLNKTEEPNMFAVEVPTGDRASRFDPKVQHARAASNASRELLDENNPRPASRTSRLDPNARGRTTSMASMGSRMMLDNDGMSMMSARDGRHRATSYSKWDLMRPKVLIMPSPLQNAQPPPAPPKVPDGFEIAADGTPLPPGARTRRASQVLSAIQPMGTLNPTNSFTPNPRMNLSLSQLTFRNTLMVDGQQDPAYGDMTSALPRATEDGQQIENFGREPTPAPIPVVVEETEEQESVVGRPAGKLYGRSLIDNLEARKAEMRGKQRTYMGGDKPAMMSRTQMQRSTTLIDPATLQRPLTQHMNSFDSANSAPALMRRQSQGPLLNFDNENRPGPNVNRNTLVPKNRSVFGVDTLWERELAKLRDIEAQEQEAAEEQRKREEEEEAAGGKKKKKKGKGKDKGKGKAAEQTSPIPTTSPQATSPIEPISAAPPVLPAIQRATVRGPPPPVTGDETESESEGSVRAGVNTRPSGEGWNSSDDEGPRHAARTGPRYPTQRQSVPVAPRRAADEDSEEDLPLAATIGRAAKRQTQLFAPEDDDSDEDKPLAAVLDKTKISIPEIDFDKPLLDGPATNPTSPPRLAATRPAKDDDDDDDEQPLGLRASTLFPNSTSIRGPAEDDDVPLAMHPEQQRRSQYNMLAMQQQQQQQQQFMMQAQAMQSMYFGGAPSVMSGFFGPPMPPPMMMVPPPSLPSPPPLHDAAKFGRVDKWRRDVATS